MPFCLRIITKSESRGLKGKEKRKGGRKGRSKEGKKEDREREGKREKKKGRKETLESIKTQLVNQ